jgi:hypothetical protein
VRKLTELKKEAENGSKISKRIWDSLDPNIA